MRASQAQLQREEAVGARLPLDATAAAVDDELVLVQGVQLLARVQGHLDGGKPDLGKHFTSSTWQPELPAKAKRPGNNPLREGHP